MLPGLLGDQHFTAARWRMGFWKYPILGGSWVLLAPSISLLITLLRGLGALRGAQPVLEVP